MTMREPATIARTSEPPALVLHASTVAIGGRAVVLIGPSGVGKSDLALRLIDRGATLVADDCTRLERDGDRLLASAPATIAGRLEVRELGIIPLPCISGVPVALAVELGEEGERMPPPRTIALADVVITALVIDPRPASAAIKVERALAGVRT